MYQYTRMPQRTRRGIGGCITGVIILLLIIGGLGLLFTRVHSGTTISVGTHPTIIGDNCSGTIFIQAGAENQITFAGIFPQYNLDSSANTVEITQCDSDLTLTVPPETNIQMDATDKITVLGVSGSMKLSTNGSRITLENVTLQGQSKIEDNGGAIVFAGSIDQGSTPTISNNGGSIDLTLPASASFHLDLTGILGPIASNFPGVQNPANATGDLHLDVGNNPSAVKLTLDLNDTDVVLSKAL